MTKPHFRLTKVKALKDFRLSLTYADGETFTVDLNDWIAKTKALKPLQDAALFARAEIGAAGSTIEWKGGEIDLAGDNLRNLAIEQAGGIDTNVSGNGCTRTASLSSKAPKRWGFRGGC